MKEKKANRILSLVINELERRDALIEGAEGIFGSKSFDEISLKIQEMEEK